MPKKIVKPTVDDAFMTFTKDEADAIGKASRSVFKVAQELVETQRKLLRDLAVTIRQRRPHATPHHLPIRVTSLRRRPAHRVAKPVQRKKVRAV